MQRAGAAATIEIAGTSVDITGALQTPNGRRTRRRLANLGNIAVDIASAVIGGALGAGGRWWITSGGTTEVGGIDRTSKRSDYTHLVDANIGGTQIAVFTLSPSGLIRRGVWGAGEGDGGDGHCDDANIVKLRRARGQANIRITGNSAIDRASIASLAQIDFADAVAALVKIEIGAIRTVTVIGRQRIIATARIGRGIGSRTQANSRPTFIRDIAAGNIVAKSIRIRGRRTSRSLLSLEVHGMGQKPKSKKQARRQDKLNQFLLKEENHNISSR